MPAHRCWKENRKPATCLDAGLHVQLSKPSRGETLSLPVRKELWRVFSQSDCDVPDNVPRSDYATNVGDDFTENFWGLTIWGSPGPTSLTNGDQNLAEFDNIAAKATGIAYAGSEVKISEVTDGTSNTYCAGEKYLQPDHYETGNVLDDNEFMYIGENEDISRTTCYRLLQDSPGYTSRGSFGGPHAGGANMAFCDGSVRSVSYEVDHDVHRCLGNRHDGEPINASDL